MRRVNPKKWGYDPQEAGALCQSCSLEGRPAVPAEIRAGARLTLVAEAPGATEETLGWPLVGPSGKETELALSSIGIGRANVSLVNAMECRVTELSYDMHVRTVRKRNEERAQRGSEPLLPPHSACLPRLREQIKGARGLLLMGKIARESVNLLSEDESDLISGRGFPGHVTIGGRRIPLVSTVHPAFVLRSQRWREIFRWDMAKALRAADRTLTWELPEMVFFPSPEQLRQLLARFDASGEATAYDVETDGLQPTEVSLRCIGIGTKSLVTCVPFASVEQGRPKWVYSREEHQRVVEIITNWFGDPKGVVCPHNGKYDQAVMEHCGVFPDFVMGRQVFDTVIAHHVAHSEWPHDLDFLITQYTDAPAHKGKDHSAWTSDYELHWYCMLDVAHTGHAAERLAATPELKAQIRTFHGDMRLSHFCRELGDLGVRIDIAERDRLYNQFTVEMAKHAANARQFAAEACAQAGGASPGARRLIESLNPGSYPQVGSILYEILGVEPAPESAGGITDTGAPSTSADTLYYIMDRGMPDLIERFLLAVIDYRGASKLRGTYCTVEPCRDGRVRPSWNPHVVVSGRLSCTGPNLMNLTPAIKTMYVCDPGHVILMCDKAQLEARIVAWLAQDRRWVEAFLAGADIHKVNAVDILGLPSVDAVSKGHRQFTKTLVYAIQYLAGLRKAYQMIRNFVDPKTGQRPYRKRSMSEISVCYNRFWQTHSPISDYHKRNRGFILANGYLPSPVWGRWRRFLDGPGYEEEVEEKANYPIQACAADDINDATERVRGEFPPGFAGRNTGIIRQCHDELALEVPESRALEIGARVVDLMYSELGDMPLPVDLNIGRSLGNKTEYEQQPDGTFVPAE